MFNQYLGQVDLTGASLNVFHTWEFAIPGTIAASLAAAPFDDLRVTLALNVPSSSTGTYVIDNLRLKGTVKPVVNCVIPLGGNGYRATFGYENTAETTITQAVGTENAFSPGPVDLGQPTSFAPGSHSSVFSAEFSGPSLTWQVVGQSATATPSSPSCPLAPTITPTVTCVRQLNSGKYEAIFGYENGTGIDTIIPVSDENRMGPGSNQDGGQVTDFKVGVVGDAFSATFGSSPITWTVTHNTVTASSSSPACPPDPPITPILEGITLLDNGGFKAAFGYQNDSDSSVTVNVGANNNVSPNPNVSSGQPTVFLPGRHHSSFSVESTDGHAVTWKIFGTPTTATTTSPQASPWLVEAGIVVNVCQVILQHLFHPPTYNDLPDCPDRSWYECLAMPQCCITKSICLANVECVVTRAVQVAAAYWDESSNVTCDFRSFQEELAIDIMQNTGLPDFILPPASAYLDITKMGAYSLSGDTKAIIHDLIQPFLDNGTSKFQLIDLDQAIVHKSDDSVAIFTSSLDSAMSTKVAMTLENMVIFNSRLDERVDAARGWLVPGAPTPTEFKNCGGESVYHKTIDTLIHELVHVRQYREMGSDRFIEEFLYEAITTGGAGGALEQEAKEFQALVEDTYNGGACGTVLYDPGY